LNIGVAGFNLVGMTRQWQLVKNEPYRVFFPLGVLAGIYGVMMWPLWHAKWLAFPPVDAHTRMMVEGFLGAFVIGFIGTAFPRLTGNRSWSGIEWWLLSGLWGMVAGCHGSGHVAMGDRVFCAMMLLMFAGMVGRWFWGNRDTPPPGFLLAMVGILGAAVAAGYLAGAPVPGSSGERWAKLMLFQGFLLLPIMGIGPYVLPRFFGANSSHSFDDSPRPPTGWCLLLAKAVVAGLLVLCGFALEVRGSPAAGQLLRAATVMVWFALETPLLRIAKQSTTPGTAVRIALVSMIAGLACAAAFPAARVGSLHLFFISGLGLFTLAVGTRVVLGHADRHDLLAGKIIWLRWVIGLALVAAFTRLTCDFIPKVAISHQIYAAWTWLTTALVWLLVLAKFLFRDEYLPEKKRKCPRRIGRKN
jgi:uncharacterized protein involved in response to NO